MIYSTNVIDLDFNDFAELNYWSSSIGPARLASITSLQLHCDIFFGGRRTRSVCPGLVYDVRRLDIFGEVWKIVAEQMTSLRTLVVRMFMVVRLYPAVEEELLRPLAQIKGLKHLSVKRIVAQQYNLRSEKMCSREFLEYIVPSRDKGLIQERANALII
ncbi:hypothetical protein MMC18_001804 [Xylographa bjoerkii]|nr:hypothetical protein [Xylographa bjoerkii]